MNNLPNTKRKSENVHSFLAFLLFICFSFTSYYIQAQEVKGITLFKFRKYSNNVIKKAKEFDNSMIITILMSPDKRYSTL